MAGLLTRIISYAAPLIALGATLATPASAARIPEGEFGKTIVHTDGHLRPGHLETIWVKHFPGRGKITITFGPTAICEGGCEVIEHSAGKTNARGRGRFRVSVPNGFFTLSKKFVPFRNHERIKVTVRWEGPHEDEFDVGSAEPEPVIVRHASGSTAGASVVKTKSAATKKKVATAPGAFCSNPIVDNYRAPLEKLQPIPALPEGGVTRFAPAGVTLAATGPQGLLVGASNVGFRLTNDSTEAVAPPKLNWTVLERLVRLTDNGTHPHPEGLKRIDLAQLPAGKHRGLTFPIPDKPAVYSVEVTIQNHRGKLLGRYGEYIREVHRVVSAGLTLAAYDNVVPGSTLEACFENHGSAAVLPGATALERFDGLSWRPVVQPPAYSPASPLAARTLGPGEAERLGVTLPTRALPGLYRLTVAGTTDTAEPVAVAAEFGVL